MNNFFKKICPFAALVCFVLCIVGAMGVIKTASESGDMIWKSAGLFFVGVSIFVFITLLALPALVSAAKPAYKSRFDKQPTSPRNSRPAPRKADSKVSKPDSVKSETVKSETSKPAARKENIEVTVNNTPQDGIRRDSGEQINDESGPVTLYVCNLSTEVSEIDVREEFGVFGLVKSVRLVTDQETGVSKGYAFVEMGSKAEADLAIDDINGQMIKEQEVQVSYARRKPRYGYRKNYRK